MSFIISCPQVPIKCPKIAPVTGANFLFMFMGNKHKEVKHELIVVKVNPPGSEEDEEGDMRSLSGGERSFSTVCFMLSLWEITESPFRCLDEFDVYMVSTQN